jgi:short chain dehydrogenase
VTRTQGAIRIMHRENISGSIVNILSVSAHGGRSFLTAYCASKAAQLNLTKNNAFALLAPCYPRQWCVSRLDGDAGRKHYARELDGGGEQIGRPWALGADG